MKKCVVCGTEFEPAKPWGTYCSSYCRVRDFRARKAGADPNSRLERALVETLSAVRQEEPLQAVLHELRDALVDYPPSRAVFAELIAPATAARRIEAQESKTATTSTRATAKTNEKHVDAPHVDPRQTTLPVVLQLESSQPITTDEVVSAVLAATSRSTGLACTPDVVRSFKGKPLDRVHAALLAADRERVIELRPESGIGLLSKADAALCPLGAKGLVLSMIRPCNAPAKPLHERFLAAVNSGEYSRKQVATALGLKDGSTFSHWLAVDGKRRDLSPDLQTRLSQWLSEHGF
mgnify:CR=1 FL=1